MLFRATGRRVRAGPSPHNSPCLHRRSTIPAAASRAETTSEISGTARAAPDLERWSAGGGEGGESRCCPFLQAPPPRPAFSFLAATRPANLLTSTEALW